MDKTATVFIPLPERGENNWDGYDGPETTARAALIIIDAAIAALNGTPQGAFLVTAPAGDQTVSAHKLIVPGGVTAPVTGNVTGNLTGNSAGVHTGGVVGDLQETVPAIVTANGAIAAKQGIVRLGGSGARANSLADPTTGTDDGKRLTIIAATAAAHVLTVTGGIGAGTNNTVTLGGAIGDMVELEAIAGKWFLRPSINATASHV